MYKKTEEMRRKARRRAEKLRDSVEEMMAIMTDENGNLPPAKPPRRKRRDTYEKIMGALNVDERADAQRFLENYVEYLQQRHEHARKRRRLRN